MLSYTLRRTVRALLTFAGLAIAVALFAGTAAGGRHASIPWLLVAMRLDFGYSSDNVPVADAIAGALPATLLLSFTAALIGLLGGWSGGFILALAEERRAPRPLEAGHGIWRMIVPLAMARTLAGIVAVCQGVPSFWLGALLVAVFGIALGWLPPGGIAAPTLPAFGADAYLAALQMQPYTILGDLLAHLILPALTLALAGLATGLRLVRATVPAEAHSPHARVARGLGLSRGRLLRRLVRAATPVALAGSTADLPLLASALVLVEYLYGWPGLGMLAYRAARAGDMATLEALVLLFGLVVVVIGLVGDLMAAWADPRLRGATT